MMICHAFSCSQTFSLSSLYSSRNDSDSATTMIQIVITS